MNPNNVWCRAKRCAIQTGKDIVGGFDIGFDERISQETKEELQRFVAWVEKNFSIPITLWVDFEYRHYLKRRDGKHVGFLYYWADFTNYPVFCNKADIPVIRLPVRMEHYTMEEILHSFVEAVTEYFMWLCNELDEHSELYEDDAEEICQAYLENRREWIEELNDKR